jgi:hypothetical protein
MDCYSCPHSGQSSLLSSNLLKGRTWRRLSYGDVLRMRKRKIAIDRLVRGHCKNVERSGVLSRGGYCVRGSERSWQWRMIELRYGFECLWAMMPKWEVKLCVDDGQCCTFARRRIWKGRQAQTRCRSCCRMSLGVRTADRKS